MIELVLNGKVYTNFTSISVTASLTDFIRTCTVSFTNENGEVYPAKANYTCKVLFNRKPIFTGWIDPISVSYSATSHDITFSGRSYTADFQDSTVGSLADSVASIKLENIIYKMLRGLGLFQINVIDATTGLDAFTANETIKNNPEETCFSVAEKYCKKRTCLIYSDANSNIILFRPEGDADAQELIEVKLQDNVPYVENVSFSYDPQNRFHTYRFRNQENPTTREKRTGTTSLKRMTSIYKTIIDPEVRPTRVKDVVFDSIHNPRYAKQRIAWQIAFDKASSFNYDVTVTGWTPLGKTNAWEVGTYVQIIDTIGGLDDTMLLGSITYNCDLSTGTTAQLNFKPPSAYVLEPEEDVVVKKKKKKKSKKDGDPELQGFAKIVGATFVDIGQ